MSPLELKEYHLKEIDVHISQVKAMIEEQAQSQESLIVFNEILQSWYAIRERTLRELEALQRTVGATTR